MKNFYEKPTQVLFVDEEGTWQGGIAYRDEVICGGCGSIFPIDDIIESAPVYVQCPIHDYNNWLNISEDIRGGKSPESFIIEPINPCLKEAKYGFGF